MQQRVERCSEGREVERAQGNATVGGVTDEPEPQGPLGKELPELSEGKDLLSSWRGEAVRAA